MDDNSDSTWSLIIRELKIVPLSDIFIHEDARETRVSALKERLERDGVQRDPIIVAPLERGKYKYVHLDGANRCIALTRLQYKHILVQVVNYRDGNRVEMETWCHLFKSSERGFLGKLNHINGINYETTSLEGNVVQKAFCESQVLCLVVFRRGDRYVITGGAEWIEKVKLLCQVSALYPSDPKRMPFDSGKDAEKQVKDSFAAEKDADFLLVFPRFTPDDIMDLGAIGERIPAGITRHMIRKRILCVNLPLSKLGEERTSEEKTTWLTDYLKRDIATGQEIKEPYRPFDEPTIIFQSKCNASACKQILTPEDNQLSESRNG